MRGLRLATVVTLGFAPCGCKNVASPNEQFREQPNKTVYRAAEEQTRQEPATIAPEQKVPGQ